MLSKKLISLLETFDKKEMKRFVDFVSSPYYNKLNYVTGLLDVIKKYHPDRLNSLSKEKAFGILYLGEKYNDEKLRNLASDLYKLAEKFIVAENLHGNDLLRKKILMEELFRREQYASYDLLYRNSKFKSFDSPNPEPYHLFFEIEKQYAVVLENLNSPAGAIDKSQQSAADNLILHFLTGITPLYAYMINQNRTLYSHNYNMNFLDDVLKHIEENDYSSHPEIMIHYKLILLFLNNTDDEYRSLKDMLRNYFGSLSVKTRENTYIALVNYCQAEIFKQRKEFLREAYETDREFITRGVFDHGLYSHIHYRNVVIRSCYLGEFDSAERFTESLRDKLAPEHRDLSYFYCKALTAFYKKDHSTAVEYLSRMSYENLSYHLEIKSLMSRIYYEQGDYEPLFSLADAYKHLLKNAKTISVTYKEYHSQFIRLVEKLAKIKLEKDVAAFDDLKLFMKKNASLMNQYWINEKISELEKSF